MTGDMYKNRCFLYMCGPICIRKPPFVYMFANVGFHE